MQLAKKKQTYFISLKDQPLFALAGIWSKWESPQGTIQTCAILTRESSGDLKKIHERAPVVIPPEMYSPWLTKQEHAEELTKNLNDFSARLNAYPVSSFVNNAKNEGAACIQPL
jgi:putative SOS response-associated peptidase YedK